MPHKKKQMTNMSHTSDIRTFLMGSPDGRNIPRESIRPGGAAGSQPGGANGFQAGGATGGAKGFQAGGATGGANGFQAGGATGGANGFQAGGATGGANGFQAGGATGGANGFQAGGATGGANGFQAGGATGGANGFQAGGATGGANGFQAGGATGGANGFQAGGATGGAKGPQTDAPSQKGVKEENNGDYTGGHLHRFTVKFSPTERRKYTVDCDRPRTVLEAIKSTEYYGMRMKKMKDENIVIHMGKEDRESIVATHFPCSCIEEGESLIISCELEKVEEAQDLQYRTVQTRDKYSVFYIDTVGGLHTKQKKLFRNNAVKDFKFLCVYGEKGMTVEEALKRDGRFIDDLSNFTLSDNKDRDSITECTQKVDNLDNGKFKICLPKNKRASDEKQQESSGASNKSQEKCNAMQVADVVQQSGVSVTAAVKKSSSNENTEEIYQRLRQQFPALKEIMESRFPDDSYQRAVKLRKENFGKIQQSFSEVHRVRKMLKLGESVCKVIVENVCQGTGFVLFDNFILTNAHLFKGCVEDQKLMDGINVHVLFNYEDPEPHTNFHQFQLASPDILYIQDELDYAILELEPEGQKVNQTTKKVKVPPGFLKKFGPMPPNGEACIIGHPAGGLKKMDPICIIEKENREQAVNDHLRPYKDSMFIVYSISQVLKNKGINDIMMGGNNAENVATYHTFMYHGSSGSPVFDAHGRVFGLHTAGYTHGFQNREEYVIEYAQPLLTIFEHFVSTLKGRSGNEARLKRVEEEAKGNSYLKKILNPTDTDEPMEH